MERYWHMKKTKVSFAALGLIFGTALGAVFTLLTSLPIYWAGAGTAIGLVIGAGIDAMKSKAA